MTVYVPENKAEFLGNGVTTQFDFDFRFFKNSDIRVTRVDAAGADTVLTSGYTVAGAGNLSGGSVTITSPVLASGERLVVERVLEAVQETDIRNQGSFYPEVHEDVFDYLTMLIQQNAGGLRHAIRVAASDPEPARLPNAAARALMLMGFDNNGNPVPVSPASGSAGELALQLLDNSDVTRGAALIGYKGRTVADIISLVVYPEDFGAVGDGVADDREAMENALDYLGTLGGGVLRLTGKYLLNSYSHNASLASAHGQILPLYSNLSFELAADAEIVIGPFFDDKPFHAFSAFNAVESANFTQVKNVHWRGGVMSFSGDVSGWKTTYGRRVGIEFGNSSNTSVQGMTFRNGDITNAVNAGWAGNGDLHYVGNCRFIDLVQENAANIDFTALYCNATRSSVVDCHFSNASRRGAEIACCVELHKSDSRWSGGSVRGYTRGAFLACMASETNFIANLEVAGIQGGVMNDFVALWVEASCFIVGVDIHDNQITSAVRDATMTDPLHYGVACLVSGSGHPGTTSAIRVHHNKFTVDPSVPAALSAVMYMPAARDGLSFTDNLLQTKRFFYLDPGLNINLLHIARNVFDVEYMETGGTYIDINANKLTASTIDIGLIRPSPLAKLLNITVVEGGFQNAVVIAPEHTSNMTDVFTCSDVFRTGAQLEYPATVSLFAPSTTGVAVLSSSVAAPAGILRGEILSRGALPDAARCGASMLADSSGVLSQIASFTSNVTGHYNTRMLLSNLQ